MGMEVRLGVHLGERKTVYWLLTYYIMIHFRSARALVKIACRAKFTGLPLASPLLAMRYLYLLAHMSCMGQISVYMDTSVRDEFKSLFWARVQLRAATLIFAQNLQQIRARATMLRKCFWMSYQGNVTPTYVYRSRSCRCSEDSTFNPHYSEDFKRRVDEMEYLRSSRSFCE